MKLILISIVVLFAVLTFVFLLFPSHIQVSRLQSIDAPSKQVMAIIKRTGEWKKWNLLAADGVNKLPVQLDVLSSSSTVLNTRWTRRGGKSFTGAFTLTGEGSGTIVQWTLDFPLHWYPWERMAGMFYEKQLGPLMDQSLLQLKGMAEHE